MRLLGQQRRKARTETGAIDVDSWSGSRLLLRGPDRAWSAHSIESARR